MTIAILRKVNGRTMPVHVNRATDLTEACDLLGVPAGANHLSRAAMALDTDQPFVANGKQYWLVTEYRGAQ